MAPKIKKSKTPKAPKKELGLPKTKSKKLTKKWEEKALRGERQEP